jgi:hypothetical protein
MAIPSSILDHWFKNRPYTPDTHPSALDQSVFWDRRYRNTVAAAPVYSFARAKSRREAIKTSRGA